MPYTFVCKLTNKRGAEVKSGEILAVSTGAHETCSINEFRSGDSDRGASIRIPVPTAQNGYGYLEDRRPGANSDPYLVAARILVSVCELDESKMSVAKKEMVRA